MAYRVKLEGSPDGQKFDFPNYDDALNFVSMAVEYGTFQDYTFDYDKDGKALKVWDDPHPIKVTMMGVEE